jgi:UDP-GlcNAc:undecaprenyl-phosphate GlcNAc-1-phosphate transferase
VSDFFTVNEILSMLGVLLISFAFCWVIVSNHKLTRFTSGDPADVTSVQSMHTKPTPRIGGVAVILAFFVGLIVNFEVIKPDLIFSIGAGIVVFFVGIREDFRRDVSPRIRLFAAFASAGAAILLSSTVINRLGLPQLDWAFGIPFFAILFTLFWSAGFCHSLNLIDGLNGFASGYAISATLGLLFIAWINGVHDIALVAALLIAAMLGFFLLNWPRGKIFLGDAGAYATGHIIAWLGIILMSRVPSVSGFAILLILFWPVADTGFTIIRRMILKLPADTPDRLHFHHLATRSMGVFFRKKTSNNVLNPISTLLLMPFVTTPIVFGVLLWDHSVKALVAILLFTTLFVSTYVFGKFFFRHLRYSRGPQKKSLILVNL